VDKRTAWLAMAVSLAVALTAPAVALDAQKSMSQFTHTAWSAKDGIPGPVRTMAQTTDGYLWLGTEAGLYRFDGLRFAPFEPRDGAHLAGSSVWSLCLARDGSLWIGFGSGGISRLHAGRLKSYWPQEGVPDGGTLSIAEDGKGSIWAAGQYGFSRFDRGQWQRVGQDFGYLAPGAQSLLVDRRGTLWVATDGLNFGLSKDPVRANTILSLTPTSKSFAQTGEAVGQVWSMAEAPDGRVWIADGSGRRVRPIGEPNAGIAVGDEPMSLLFDGDRSLWTGLIEGGLRRRADLRLDGEVLDRSQASDGLSGTHMYSTLKDREGNVWFGTDGGLDRFRENKVTPFSAREGLAPDQQIALTSTEDGSVWLVSYTRDAVRRYWQGQFLTSRLPPYSTTDSTRILSLYADQSSRVWVGGSFQLASEVNGKFSYLQTPRLEGGAMVEAVARDAAGDLWVTRSRTDTVGGILRLQNGTWTDLRARADLPRYRCRILYPDAVGRLWLGFENGQVAVYDSSEFHVYSAKDGLPNGRVLAIAGDRARDVWIGSEGGLSRFDRGRFVTLTRENGLPGNSVSGVVVDEEGSLWLAGALGILRVHPRELAKALTSPSYRMQGTIFDSADGLRGLPRQREPFPTATRAADGRLWFATTGGVAVIDPKRLPRNVVPPPVAIEEMNADNRSLPATSGIRLPPNTRSLEFRYSALSLTDPDRVRFRYKLEGYDDDWRGPVNSRAARYTNLPPRNYRFHVIACNNDGVWNETGAALELSIAPAFYQTGWFLLLGLAAAGGLAWAGYRRHIHQVTGRLDMQFEERLSERARIARELHDTLLQSFQGLMLNFQKARNLFPGDPAEATHTLDGALDGADRAITEGRDAIQGIRSGNELGIDLAEAITALGEELAATEGAETPEAFRVEVEGTPRALRPILRDEIYGIAREALRNAFRHAGASRIETDISYGKRLLRMRIRDNGNGIDPSVLDQGGRAGHWGLVGMRERAKSHGVRLEVWSREGAGTEVEVSAPASIAYEGSPARSGFRLFRGKAEPKQVRHG
jgi:signal transduction histidine kinase/ligand-binding sensor domain-containing protein